MASACRALRQSGSPLLELACPAIARCARIAVCLLAAFAGVAGAADPSGDSESAEIRAGAVDTIFSEWDRKDSPGAAVGVYHNGKQVFAKGYGSAHLEHGVPITPQTVFHVASLSKQFTAFAAALLAAEGKLDLEADIRGMLDAVPDFAAPGAPAVVITPRHLIHHTSGLRDQWSLFVLGGQELDNRLRQSHVLNMVSRQQALNFPPGSDYSYSNTGYTLLAELVAGASGKSLREYTAEAIFEPLGMKSTLFYDDVTEIVRQRAESYAKGENGEWRRELLNFDNVGATSLHTTAEDMLRWAANFTEPTVGNREILETIGRMGRLDDGTPINYGFALAATEIAGRRALWHTGSDAAYRAAFAVFPDDDFAVVILANTPMNRLVQITEIASAYLDPGEPKDVWRTNMPHVRADSKEADALIGHYRFPSRPMITIERREDGLAAAWGSEEAQVLTLREDGTFDFGDEGRIWGTYYQPKYGPDGEILAIEERGSNVVEASYPAYERIEPAIPAESDLRHVAGKFSSPELDVTYTVSARAGGLDVDSIWLPEPIRLRPTIVDHFTGEWPMHDVAVERDAQGRVAALLVSSERARNVRFVKRGQSKGVEPN